MTGLENSIKKKNISKYIYINKQLEPETSGKTNTQWK